MIRSYDRRVIESGGRRCARGVHEPAAAPIAWTMVIRFPVRDAAGRSPMIGGFDLDITRAEGAPSGRCRRASSASASSPRPTPCRWSCCASEDSRVLFVNPAFLELLQHQPERLDASTSTRCGPIRPSGRPISTVCAAMARSDDFDVVLRRQDGTVFPASAELAADGVWRRAGDRHQRHRPQPATGGRGRDRSASARRCISPRSWPRWARCSPAWRTS